MSIERCRFFVNQTEGTRGLYSTRQHDNAFTRRQARNTVSPGSGSSALVTGSDLNVSRICLLCWAGGSMRPAVRVLQDVLGTTAVGYLRGRAEALAAAEV